MKRTTNSLRYFLTNDQEYFIYLHKPVCDNRSVLNLLHQDQENLRKSLNSLCNYLSLEHETKWISSLFPLIKQYYNKDNVKIDESVIVPIYTGYGEAQFTRFRKLNPIRNQIIFQAIKSQCFYRLSTQHDLLTWFQKNISRTEDVYLGQRDIPNYRFVAEGYLSVGDRRFSNINDKKNGCFKYN